MSNDIQHPGLVLSEQYIQALRMPVASVARMTHLQLELMESFFRGACDLNAAQASALGKLLGTWWPAEKILEAQSAYRENNLGS